MNVQTPKVQTPGSATVPKAYEHQEFPKAVYGPGGLEDCVIIESEEERPDGYVDYDDAVDAGKSDEEKKAEAAAKKKATAAEKKKAAKEAEEALRVEIMAYLDANNVEYNRDDISTEDLEKLKVQLDAHLKGSGDDA